METNEFKMKNIFPEIKTERLILRKLREKDWKVISYLRTDKEVNKYVNRSNADSKEKALEFISKTNNGVENKSIYYWSISEKDNGNMIGSICLWNFCTKRNSGEVGYDLSPEFQGRGIMTESLKAILNFGFQTLNLNLIEAYTHSENKSSFQLLEKNGFTFIKDKKDENNLNNVIYEVTNPAIVPSSECN